MSNPWTDPESSFLAEHYEARSPRWVAARLGRSLGAVWCKAASLGLVGLAKRGRRPGGAPPDARDGAARKYDRAAIDAAIMADHEANAESGGAMVARIARETGFSPTSVTRRMEALRGSGVIPRPDPAASWSEYVRGVEERREATRRAKDELAEAGAIHRAGRVGWEVPGVRWSGEAVGGEVGR